MKFFSCLLLLIALAVSSFAYTTDSIYVRKGLRVDSSATIGRSLSCQKAVIDSTITADSLIGAYSEVGKLHSSTWIHADSAITADSAIVENGLTVGGNASAGSLYSSSWLQVDSLATVDSLKANKSIIADTSITTASLNLKLGNKNFYSLTDTSGSPDTILVNTVSGIDEAFDATYEAIKITVPADASRTQIFSIWLKRTGTITNKNSLMRVTLNADNAGLPGSQVAGTSASDIYLAGIPTSYTEIQNLLNFSEYVVAGTTYWIVMQSYIAPSGGTISVQTTDTGTGLYAENTGSWAAKNNRTAHFAIYKGTSNWYKNSFTGGISNISGHTGITSMVLSGGPSATCFNAFGGSGAVCYSGVSTYGAIVKGSTTYGVAIACSTHTGTAIRGVVTSTQAGTAGYFIGGGAAGGKGIYVERGVVTDSLICSDSVARPAPSTGTVATTKFWGVDGDTVLCTPKIWMSVTVKGIKYKVPLY